MESEESQAEEQETVQQETEPIIETNAANILFVQEMQWGEQPVRLTAYRQTEMPTEAPVTSVHVVAFQGDKVLAVRDRRGIFGFPGGRLESGESYEQALAREVFEEARAVIRADVHLFAMMKIECTTKLPHRNYPHPYTYMAMYAGAVESLKPVGNDPAGVITGRDLFNFADSDRFFAPHDKILLKEAIKILSKKPEGFMKPLHAYLAWHKQSKEDSGH